MIYLIFKLADILSLTVCSDISTRELCVVGDYYNVNRFFNVLKGFVYESTSRDIGGTSCSPIIIANFRGVL